MKSCVTHIQGLYAAIFADVQLKIPSIHRELNRDHSRLRSSVEGRGHGVYTMDLPALGKHFDKCLSAGRLTQSNLALSSATRKGEVIPKLFRGLLLRVFDKDGLLLINPDIVAILCLRQLYYAAKKLRMETSAKRRFNTVKRFFEIDEELRRPSLSWDTDDFDAAAAKGLDLRDSFGLLPHPLPLFNDRNGRLDSSRGSSYQVSGSMVSRTQQVFDIIASGFGRFDPSAWKQKHGPGAVSDRRGLKYSKYSFPYWPEKLGSVFPADEFAYANINQWVSDTQGAELCGLIPHEPPARLITVPKTMKAPRLIASEPTCHMWAQQSIRQFLVQSMSNTCTPIQISTRIGTACASSLRPGLTTRSQELLSDDMSSHSVARGALRSPLSWTISMTVGQTRARALALEASHTQSHATVDLSDASDRLSCWLVERLFRSNASLLQALHATRTRWVVNTIDRNSPKYKLLRKFACMGSACTFPVQSIAYAGVAIAALLERDGLRVNYRNVARAAREVLVFGDDTIIPERGLDLFKGMLEYLQFEVNYSKTYGQGKFRESCGMDAFDGTNVTPTYSIQVPLRTQPESVISSVESSNNFYMKGWYSVAAWIKSTVEREISKEIPCLPTDSGSFGWKRAYWKGENRRTRWNPNLQCLEVLGLRPKVKAAKLPDHTARSLLQYFTEEPPPESNWESGVPTRPKVNLRLGWEALVDL